MPLLDGIGRLLFEGGGSARMAPFVAGAIGLGALGAIEGRKASKASFDYASEALLGTPNADQLIAGRDLGWGSTMFPEMFNPATAGVAGGIVGGGIGGAAGYFGGSFLSHRLGLGGAGTVAMKFLGALGGAALGGSVGAVGGAVGPMLPYTNSATLHDAFAPDKPGRALRNLARANVQKGYNDTDIPNSIFPYGGAYTSTGVAAYPDYYANDFPGPVSRPRRYTTGATGDLVLGAYNLRMG